MIPIAFRIRPVIDPAVLRAIDSASCPPETVPETIARCFENQNHPTKEPHLSHETAIARRYLPRLSLRLRRHHRRFNAAALHRLEEMSSQNGTANSKSSSSIPGAANRSVKSSPRSTGEMGLNMPVEAVATRKESLYYEQLPQLKAIPEVLEHIEAQHGRIPFAVVSGSRRNSVVGSLTALNLLDKFDTIVSAEDYKNAKPAPDAFLLAADRLGVAPEDCLVFEDTEMGIQAATAAGMASVRVPMPAERI